MVIPLPVVIVALAVVRAIVQEGAKTVAREDVEEDVKVIVVGSVHLSVKGFVKVVA